MERNLKFGRASYYICNPISFRYSFAFSQSDTIPDCASKQNGNICQSSLPHAPTNNNYIREQMQDYHPTLLPKLTIKENYQNLLDGISQSFPNRNICVSFDCSDSLFLVEPYNIFVYRLLKELVTNVYKHSTGEKAWITLTQDNGIIILSVSDNGTVDADVLSSADRLKHRGLAMITERVNDMDGSVTISNNHPHGICVQTILPMKGDVSYQHFVSR